MLGGTPHADNVGPALLGGVVLVRGYRPFDIVRLPVPDNFFYAVAHPGIVVSTREAVSYTHMILWAEAMYSTLSAMISREGSE